jgi:hypothetical protein
MEQNSQADGIIGSLMDRIVNITNSRTKGSLLAKAGLGRKGRNQANYKKPPTCFTYVGGFIL